MCNSNGRDGGAGREVVVSVVFKDENSYLAVTSQFDCN